ncbi:MAG: Ig-like domain-containing protein, partial [Lachnospirales bacterium]
MKKRLSAIIMALCFSVSSIGLAFGDDSASGETENTIEITTEEETTTETTTEETTTETTTKETTETTTKETTTKATETTESTTTSATTTTKSQATYTDEKKEYTITLDKGNTQALSGYLDRTILSSSDYDWYSNNTSVVTVDKNGTITGVKSGSANVTATATDGSVRYSYTFDITVNETTAANSTKSITVYVDKTKDLHSYVDDRYSASNYTWMSNNTKYVTVSNNGVITGEKEGSATVTAIYDKNDVYLKYEFSVRVYEDDDDSSSKVSYSSNSGSTSKYSSSNTTAYIRTSWTLYMGPNDSVDLCDILEDDPDDYDWNVSDEDIVEINEKSGILSALENGSTKVTAKGDNDFTFTVKIDDDYSIQELSISGTKSRSLKEYLSGDVDEYHFSSNREDVLEVDSDGDMKPIANGAVAVTCDRDGGEVIMFLINVTGISTSTKTTESYEYTEITTSSAFATTKAATTTFTDISHRAWAIDSINKMSSKGIILGVGNNKFAPDNNCIRADFTIVLTKILGIDNIKASNNYDDVQAS